MKFADLHVHSVYSDGTFQPAALVKEAVRQKLSAIALTDHDTVAGLDAAIASGQDCGIEVLPGIELTAEHEGVELHILGYLIDQSNAALLKMLSVIAERRIERVYEMAKKLQEQGIQLLPEAVFACGGAGTIGRMHVAQAMVKDGLVASAGEAFARFIGDKGPAYVAGFHLSPQEAIRLIKDAGGVAALAHPYTITNDELVIELIKQGIKGLEAYYPEHSQSTINFYLKLVQEYDLIAVGGSDFHGAAKPKIKMGAVKVPYSVVEELKAAACHPERSEGS
jgi:predicted metal-dependent phosphoesterase TrpH